MILLKSWSATAVIVQESEIPVDKVKQNYQKLVSAKSQDNQPFNSECNVSNKVWEH